MSRTDTKADTSMDVLCGWLEPCVTLRLQKASDKDSSHRITIVDLSENMVQQSIICVVIHGLVRRITSKAEGERCLGQTGDKYPGERECSLKAPCSQSQ